MMDCDEIRGRILAGDPVTGPEVEQHLAGCEACRELLEAGSLGSLFRDAAGSDDEIDDLRPLPTGGLLDRLRSVSTRRRVIAVAVVLLAVGGLNALALLRADAPGYPAVRMYVTLAAFALAALVAGIHVLRPIHLRRPPAFLLPMLVILGVILPVAFSLPPAAHDLTHTHPESFHGTGDDFWPRAIGCLIYGTVMGAPILLMLGLLGRGGKAPSTTVLAGLTAMALAGNVALQLHCPLVSPVHLLVGHAGVPVVLLLIGLPFALRRARARKMSGSM